MTHLAELRSFSRYRLCAFSLTALVSIALWMFSMNAQARGHTSDAPQELKILASLDDQQLQSRLGSDWNNVRATLERHSPQALMLQASRRGFGGPQQACLQTRSASACRIHMGDLMTIKKQGQQQSGSLLVNPWTATPR